MIHQTSFAGIAGLIVWLCFPQDLPIKPSPGSQVSTMHQTGLPKMQLEAVRLWEQALSAKGGRDRLVTVQNMLISSSAEYTRDGKRNQVRRENLFVFPNKYWFYEDYGRDIFGTRMDMRDYDSKMGYAGSPGHPDTRLEPIKEQTRNTRLDNAAIAVLLETKWLRPIPLKARTERIGPKKVDVVETLVNGRRVDFAFDRKTHLPIRVSFYNTINNKTYSDVQQFSDYVEVGGIRVPQRVKFDDGTEEKSVIQFNVEYNPEIFVKPPPAGSGPKAWKPKS